MREVLDTKLYIEEYALEAMHRVGIKPRQDLVRGGTDGSRLSFMGLPCPNLFTGEMAIHGKHEYVSVQDMEAAIKTCIELVQVYEEKAWYMEHYIYFLPVKHKWDIRYYFLL